MRGRISSRLCLVLFWGRYFGAGVFRGSHIYFGRGLFISSRMRYVVEPRGMGIRLGIRQ